MKMMKRLIFTCAMMANLFSQNNSQLSIQGVLRSANGTAVENGQYFANVKLGHRIFKRSFVIARY